MSIQLFQCRRERTQRQYPEKAFDNRLKRENLALMKRCVRVLQVNIGKKCNQACLHCHVEAGPLRTENMTRATVDRLLALLRDDSAIESIDITGGAPELNPHFFFFVEALKDMRKHVIDRCNLSVLFEKGQEETARFLAAHKVQIIASLPCYTTDAVDQQRGRGVFKKSIEGLQLLNRFGYGEKDTGLLLDLVYNPTGIHLPPAQGPLEQTYKARLYDEWGIRFNSLYTMTNMPIKRFLRQLEHAGKTEEYMDLLMHHFNAKTVSSLMCAYLVSVDWRGHLYDCDFNQALEKPTLESAKRSIWDIRSFQELAGGTVATGQHCFGCTASSGSSCLGALSAS